MKDRVWNLVGRARRLEDTLASRIEGTARQLAGPPATRPPLEVVHELVNAVAHEVQPIGRGRHGFPFNAVRVTLVAPSARERAQWQAICDGPQPLRDRIVERLRAAGASVSDLSVKVAFVPQAGPDWAAPEFHLDFARRSHATEPDAAPASVMAISIVAGVATQASYELTGPTVAIGRGAEVRDARQRLIRTNHVAFVEGGGEVNDSVSRRHARVELDPAAGAWRLIDDGSAQGTYVVRGGRGVPVPPGTRGLRLRSGDEIVLGRARVRVAFPAGTPK